MSEHTPGPWVIPAGDGNEHVICAGDAPDKPGRILFILENPRGTRRLLPRDELAANARLIAAAPDMLAVLKRIRDSFPGYIPDFVESVNAAIANAEGSATIKPTEREGS